MNAKQKLRLGTRGSQLAMWQAYWVRDELIQLGHEVELVEITTTGDTRTEALSQMGGYGVFTKEIQRALMDESIDLAVHSLKDLPTLPNDALQLACVPKRADPRDVLVSETYTSIAELPNKAKVGTGSLRRKAQLLHQRPDLDVQGIRGNVDTRLRKLKEEGFDAIVLAQAGLMRLNLGQDLVSPLSPTDMLPAAGQGALGIEIRSGDDSTAAALAPLCHQDSLVCVSAEREMLARLCAGCLAPVGVLAQLADGKLSLEAAVYGGNGSEKVASTWQGESQDALSGGRSVADELLEKGAAALIESARQ